VIHHLLLGTRRKSHGQNSGSLEKFQKSSRDAVPRGGGLGSRPKKNVRGEVRGWGRVPFNEPYTPSLSTIYDGA